MVKLNMIKIWKRIYFYSGLVKLNYQHILNLVRLR
jgi:hypothetical protein